MRDHNRHKYKGIFKGFFHQLLTIDIIRYIVARLRFFFLVRIFRRLKTFDIHSGSVSSHTISHNLKGLKDLAVVRSLALIKPLTAVDRIGTDSKVLTIGPRTEGELLSLIGYGFLPENIRGLDLISYSKWIDLGDMHHMSYADNSFDAVIMGWVISYSENPVEAAKEVIRVCKNNAVVAVGVEYAGDEGNRLLAELDYTPGAGRLTTHSQQLLDFFGENVNQIYFTQSIEEDRVTLKGSVIAVFSIKK